MVGKETAKVGQGKALAGKWIKLDREKNLLKANV